MRQFCVCLSFMMIAGLGVSAQHHISKQTLDSLILQKREFQHLRSKGQPFNYLYHFPNEEDEQCYKKYRQLIGQKPTDINYRQYYSLARSLWNLKKIASAEKMCLAIVRSEAPFYTSTYHHSSDIPGDTTQNIYGYGSFTSSYKNYAAICLTKIYLERRQFNKALHFLEDAVKKYKVSYSCGTGFHRQQDEYAFLYASCYKGLNRNKAVIDLLMPDCLTRNDTLIIAAIRASYSPRQTREYLAGAKKSITCSLDSLPSYAYRTAYNDGKEGKTDTIKYFSGSATILLFGRRIDMPSPDLEDGEHLTWEHFIKLLEESDFYIRLTESNSTRSGSRRQFGGGNGAGTR